MSDNTFTPGPWTYMREDPTDGTVAGITAPTRFVVEFIDEPTETDARLMCAGPDLLAALEELVHGIERWNESVETIIGRVPNTGMGLDKARAAIAKARGGA